MIVRGLVLHERWQYRKTSALSGLGGIRKPRYSLPVSADFTDNLPAAPPALIALAPCPTQSFAAFLAATRLLACVTAFQTSFW